MIEMRRAQLNFGEGLIAEEVSDLAKTGCSTLMRRWWMRASLRPCMRRWRNGTPRAAAEDVGGKTPDAKTMGRWSVALGPKLLKQIQERMVRLARDNGVIRGGGCV